MNYKPRCLERRVHAGPRSGPFDAQLLSRPTPAVTSTTTTRSSWPKSPARSTSNCLPHHLLSEADDDKERAYLINREIDDIRGTIVRQTMFAEFEKITPRDGRSGRAADRAGVPKTLTASCWKTTSAPSFAIDDQLSLECLRIPHFYRAFYVYKYATGLSAAIALSQRVLDGGEPELQRLPQLPQRRLLEVPARPAARRRRRHGTTATGRNRTATFRFARRPVGRIACRVRSRCSRRRQTVAAFSSAVVHALASVAARNAL